MLMNFMCFFMYNIFEFGVLSLWIFSRSLTSHKIIYIRDSTMFLPRALIPSVTPGQDFSDITAQLPSASCESHT